MSVFQRYCAWLWSLSEEQSPAPEKGWSGISLGCLPPLLPPPQTLHTRFYQTGSALLGSACRCLSSPPFSSPPAPGCISHSDLAARLEHRVTYLPFYTYIHTLSHMTAPQPHNAGTLLWRDVPPAPWFWLFSLLEGFPGGTSGLPWRIRAFLHETAAGGPASSTETLYGLVRPEKRKNGYCWLILLVLFWCPISFYHYHSYQMPPWIKWNRVLKNIYVKVKLMLL